VGNNVFTYPLSGNTLSSKWDGLNLSLFAFLQEAGFDGKKINDTKNATIVAAPFTEGQIESKQNWTSYYEQKGVEGMRPALAYGAQSGLFLDLAKSLRDSKDVESLNKLNGSGSIAGKYATAGAIDILKKAEGRHGMTKVNSRQIYSGSTPVTIPLTLKFRAFEDPAKEVEEPIDQLWQWTLPKEIIAGSALSNFLNRKTGGGAVETLVESLLPSRIPSMLWLQLGGGSGARSFSPMVIESMGHPLKVPRSKDGEMLNVEVQLSLSTLTAMDVLDWKNTRQGQPIKLVQR
jgi:hypothetical protein